MRNLFYGLMLVLGSLAYAQQTVPPGAVDKIGAVDQEIPKSTTRGGSVLFSTFPGIVNPSPFTISSQNFTDASFTSQGADDFTVTGNGWTINMVEVRGTYYEFSMGGPTGPADSVNVYILGNSGSLPDTTNLSAGAIYAAENLSYNDVAFGDFEITLPGGGVTLLPGTYWIVVQANMAVLAGGQWGWTESSSTANSGTPVGFESAWFQSVGAIPPANGGGFTCVGAWGRRVTDCDITIPADPNPPPEFDLAFELSGTSLTPGVSVTPTMLTTSEAGVSDSFDVVLTAPPVGGNSVDVPIGAANPAEGTVSTTMLNFTAANWNIPQTVTVTPVDDLVADGDVMYTLVNGPTVSGDGAYSGLAVDAVDVTNQDNEIAGVTVNPVSGLQVSEDGTLTANFDVNLNVMPTDGGGETVTIPLSLSDPSLAMLSTTALMFTDTTPQTVTITGIDDDIDNGNLPFMVITGDPTSTSMGSAYDNLTAADVADVSATRIDDDTAGVTVTAVGGQPIVTTEAGATGTVSVVLNSEPTDNVNIGVFSSDVSEGTVAPMSLVFTPGNWDTPQVITVTGQNDLIDDGNVPYTIGLAPVISNDTVYNGIDPADVAAVNNDDADTAGFTINPTSGLTTTEAGGTDTFTVVLDSEPIFSVMLPLSSDNTAEGLISTDGITFGPNATLTFTTGNWNVPQTITVEGQDDLIRADGDIVYNIVTGDPVSGDVPYNNLTGADVADVEVTNTDDDGPAVIIVTPLSITTFEDPLQPPGSFSVVLGTQPTANVTIDVASDNLAEGAPDVASLIFTPGNYDTPQIVNVQGVNEFIIDGDQNYNIVLSPAVSADVNYSGLDPDDVAAVNVDDDVCGPVTITCILGGPITLFGTPTCVVDLYDSHGSNDPNDWTLLASGVEIGLDGSVVVPGVVCQPDTFYVVTETGFPNNILSRFRSVPTLGRWALIGFVSLLAVVGIVFMRRRRLA